MSRFNDLTITYNTAKGTKIVRSSSLYGGMKVGTICILEKILGLRCSHDGVNYYEISLKDYGVGFDSRFFKIYTGEL